MWFFIVCVLILHRRNYLLFSFATVTSCSGAASTAFQNEQKVYVTFFTKMRFQRRYFKKRVKEPISFAISNFHERITFSSGANIHFHFLLYPAPVYVKNVLVKSDQKHPIALFDWTNKRPQHIHTKFVVHAFSYSLRVSMAVERKKSSV